MGTRRSAESTLRDVQQAAPTLGLQIQILKAGTIGEIDAAAGLEIRRAEDIAPAIEGLKGRADALYVVTDPLVNTHRIQINALALGARLPTMHGEKAYVQAGGLMAYGPNFPDLFRRAGDYADKILRGAKPADIPVEQPRRIGVFVALSALVGASCAADAQFGANPLIAAHWAGKA